MKVQSSAFVLAAAVLLLALMAILSDGAVRHESITFDEVAHIAAGVSYLQKLDMRMNEEHPPLAKVLAALPLIVRGVRADYSQVSWSFSGSGFVKQVLGEWIFGYWLIARWNEPVATVFWARQPMLCLTLLLGIVLFMIGARLGGHWGGLLCLCAFTTMPVMLTFGPLVLTDIAVTLFAVLTMWTFAELWRTPSHENILKFGLALGAALLSKFSAWILFFCFLTFVLSLRWLPLAALPVDEAELRSWRRLRRSCLGQGILLAFLAVYLVYFILSWNEPTDSLAILGQNAASMFLRRALMPPWIYLRGLTLFVVIGKPPAFLLGHSYPHGTPLFFPALTLLKSPLAFLLLLLLSLVVGLLASRRPLRLTIIPNEMTFHWRAMWIFLVAFAGICILSPFQFTIRHFSFPLVLLILLLAPLPKAPRQLRASGSLAAHACEWCTAALALALIVTAIRAYPFYLPFLNAFAGNRPGYDLISDSNLDWNQALPQAEQFVRKRGLTRVLIDPYGFSDPALSLPEGHFWNCQEAKPDDGGQWAFVSANLIRESHNCTWLLQFPHESIGGGSMYAFDLPPLIAPAGAPGGPPTPADYRVFANTPFPGDIRLTWIKCMQDPSQLQPTWDSMMAWGAELQKKRRGAVSRK